MLAYREEKAAKHIILPHIKSVAKWLSKKCMHITVLDYYCCILVNFPHFLAPPRMPSGLLMRVYAQPSSPSIDRTSDFRS